MPNSEKIICAACGKYCPNHDPCPSCGSESFFYDRWWYEKSIPADGVNGKILPDGRKVIPRFFVEVRAYLHPHSNGEPLSSWTIAEEWFRNLGWEWIEDEEWYPLAFRRET